jgi:hypothetical protein
LFGGEPLKNHGKPACLGVGNIPLGYAITIEEQNTINAFIKFLMSKENRIGRQIFCYMLQRKPEKRKNTMF